jgi:hypothetical protein
MMSGVCFWCMSHDAGELMSSLMCHLGRRQVIIQVDVAESGDTAHKNYT